MTSYEKRTMRPYPRVYRRVDNFVHHDMQTYFRDRGLLILYQAGGIIGGQQNVAIPKTTTAYEDVDFISTEVSITSPDIASNLYLPVITSNENYISLNYEDDSTFCDEDGNILVNNLPTGSDRQPNFCYLINSSDIVDDNNPSEISQDKIFRLFNDAPIGSVLYIRD